MYIEQCFSYTGPSKGNKTSDKRRYRKSIDIYKVQNDYRHQLPELQIVHTHIIIYIIEKSYISNQKVEKVMQRNTTNKSPCSYR